MTLGDLWFIIVAIFWVGFFVLEGFDFGVGMLHSFIGRNDTERRVADQLHRAGLGRQRGLAHRRRRGDLRRLPRLVRHDVLDALPRAWCWCWSALIVRGLSFEWQRKFDDPAGARFWRWGLTIGSALIPFLVGVALGDLLHGLPINSQHKFTGGFWQLLTPFGLWTGVTLVVLSLLSGATYLSLKTTGELHDRAQRSAAGIGLVAVIVTFGFMTWIHVGLGTGFVPEPLEALALLAVIVAAWAARERAEGWAFMAAASASAAPSAPSSPSCTRASWSRPPTPPTTSPSPTRPVTSYSLRVMTVVAAIFFPLVLLYQGWTYRVFRRRLSVPQDGTADPVPRHGPDGLAGACADGLGPHRHDWV